MEGLSTQATTRRGPPQRSQVRTSSPNVRFSNWAHGTREVRVALAAGGGSGEGEGRGTTSGRRRALGARTPEQRTRWTPGGGTRAARRGGRPGGTAPARWRKNPLREKRSATSRYRSQDNQLPPGCDVDHCVDLQLNGRNSSENMLPLDSSVNRSLGAQIQQAIKDLPPGTPIGKITLE